MNQDNKQCSRCDYFRSINDFYVKNKKTGLRNNICNKCNREVTKKWAFDNKEKRRDQSKKHYQEHKEKIKKRNSEYLKRFPEKLKAHHAVQTVKVPKGFDKHHWSYLEDNRKCIFILSRKHHCLLHDDISYDQEFMCYRDKEGNLLDTREKHEEVINSFIFF